jgi:hypothetical protein
VTATLTTWEQLGDIEENVLLVVNSPADDVVAVDAALEELKRRVKPSALHAIAPSFWTQRLTEQGFTADRVLVSRHADVVDLELMFFLESSTALLWVARRQFKYVVGSVPHSLYNDEIKTIFEQRVAVLLGQSLFLAQTLPNPYVFVFDLPQLLRRMGRQAAVDEYRRTCGALIDEYYQLWIARQKPRGTDDEAFPELETLARHLGSDLLAFDENSRIPLLRPDTSASLTDFIAHTHQRLVDLAEAVHLKPQP